MQATATLAITQETIFSTHQTIIQAVTTYPTIPQTTPRTIFSIKIITEEATSLTMETIMEAATIFLEITQTQTTIGAETIFYPIITQEAIFSITRAITKEIMAAEISSPTAITTVTTMCPNKTMLIICSEMTTS
jgi:hypothetical protein